MKKILIVSRFFYPMNTPRAFRTTELAKEMARQGHQVTVLVPKQQEHEAFEAEYGVTIKDLGQLSWKEVALKGKKIPLLLRRGVRRFSNLLLEYPDIQLMRMVRKKLAKEENYDFLISIAVPHPIHWGVAAARSVEHPIAKTWIADCGDPFMGQENDSFKKPFYFAGVEKWFSRKADFITVPTEGAIQAYYPEFREKIKVIPQGFRFEDIELQDSKNLNSSVEFAYAGAFIPGRRDPTEFLEYLIQTENDFRFYVYTHTPALVEPFAAKSNGRIILKEPIPRNELLHELSGLDFVVNFENVGTKQTPSKLIDYHIIEKPILSLKTGALNIGLIEAFFAGDYSESYRITDPDQYRIENVVNKFLALENKNGSTKDQ